MIKRIDIDKFDKLVKEESEKPKGESHCPECGSYRLYYFIGGKAGWIYVCKDCRYQGPVVIEDGEVANEIRKKWFKNNKD